MSNFQEDEIQCKSAVMPLPTQGLSTTNVLCESLPQGVSELQEVKIKGSKKLFLLKRL